MTIDAITPGARVLCAVSGGVDSMYLLHRMTELAAQRGFTVGCAHFNHALRGAESDRDEAFVRAQCQRLNVPFYAGRGDVASVRGMGTEGAARQLRYAFLTDCAAAHGYDWIATAHTADDNAETLLLNLARGCGLRGLTGIPPQRGKLLRPMLDTTRAEAEAYLAAHGIDIHLRGGDLRTGKGDGAGRWLLEQVQAAQERRLTGAGGADNDHIFTGADMLGNIIEHEVVAERFGQMFNVDHFDAASFQAHRAAWKTA